jgi:hypothetical protein
MQILSHTIRHRCEIHQCLVETSAPFDVEDLAEIDALVTMCVVEATGNPHAEFTNADARRLADGLYEVTWEGAKR